MNDSCLLHARYVVGGSSWWMLLGIRMSLVDCVNGGRARVTRANLKVPPYEGASNEKSQQRQLYIMEKKEGMTGGPIS